jgi:hypothetical protein
MSRFNELLLCDSTVLHRIGTAALPRLDHPSASSSSAPPVHGGGRSSGPELQKRLRLIVPFSSLLLLRMQAGVSGTDLEHSEAYAQLRFLGQCGSQFIPSAAGSIGVPSAGTVRYTELAPLQPEALPPLTFLPPSEELLLFGLALAPSGSGGVSGPAAAATGESLVRAARFFQQPLRALQTAVEEGRREHEARQRDREYRRELQIETAVDEASADDDDGVLARALAAAPPLLRDGIDGGWGGEVALRVACGMQHRLNAVSRTEPCVAGVASKAPVLIKRAWAAGVRCESLAAIMSSAGAPAAAGSLGGAPSEGALGSPTPVDAHRTAAAHCARVARRFARREAGLVQRGSTLPSFMGGAGRAPSK